MVLPGLSSPLSPVPVVDEVAPESSVGSLAGVPVAPSSNGMPDLSREGPFHALQDAGHERAMSAALQLQHGAGSYCLIFRKIDYII